MYFRLFIIFFVAAFAYKAIYFSTRGLTPALKVSIGVAYWLIVVVLMSLLTYSWLNWSEMHDKHPELHNFVIGAVLTMFFTTLIISIFHLFDDIIWLVRKLAGAFRSKESLPGTSISRTEFLTKSGLALGGVIFGSFMWGITKGKFNFRVIEQKLAFNNLPKAFNGLRIVQISDAHLGSFNNNLEPIKHCVEMVNDLKPDVIVFTGDLVNTHHEEALPWIDVFRKLEAPMGKFSILGNHDYGYYGDLTEAEQVAVRQGVIDIEKEMGFQPLINEHVHLEKDGDKLAVIGVENWGKSHWFPKAGDYKLASQGVSDETFQLLLSHDPTHWDEHIVGQTAVDLTLSGHTHGAQMGISIPGVLEISPAQLLFKRAKGLYTEGKQQLYVNRGLGFLIFPGRVGMAPEITCLDLSVA
ncbi:MAG: metallophosphoesterase [Flavobacteriales bacterium]|nr:metallophosphoesterase [Flavobacteriales bacterium]